MVKLLLLLLRRKQAFCSFCRISVVPTAPDQDPTLDRLLCYATKNKVGLQLLPLDGNPHRSTSCIAHPGGIAAISCGYDGGHIFTAGGREATVHMWSINKKYEA